MIQKTLLVCVLLLFSLTFGGCQRANYTIMVQSQDNKCPTSLAGVNIVPQNCDWDDRRQVWRTEVEDRACVKWWPINTDTCKVMISPYPNPDKCLVRSDDNKVSLTPCDRQNSLQLWKVSFNGVIAGYNEASKCLATNGFTYYMETCKSTSSSQKWTASVRFIW